MTSCMRSRRAFDNPDTPMEPLLPFVLFRLADGAAEVVALLGNLRRSSSGTASPFTSITLAHDPRTAVFSAFPAPCSAQGAGNGTLAKLRHSIKQSRFGAQRARRSRALQAFNINFVHFQHGVHDSLRRRAVFGVQEFTQNRRNDLPGHTEFVLEPTASVPSSARRELFPQGVDFLLRLAIDEEGDRRREGVLRPAVQSDKILPFDLECDRHDGTLWSGSGFTVTRNVPDL